MRYRRMTPEGDYTFGLGKLNFLVDSSEAVAQAVMTRLRLLRGEWFLDVEEGTPYATEILGTNTRSTRDIAIRTRILATPGVIAMTAYASQLIDRNFSVQATISTSFGETTIKVSL